MKRNFDNNSLIFTPEERMLMCSFLMEDFVMATTSGNASNLDIDAELKIAVLCGCYEIKQDVADGYISLWRDTQAWALKRLEMGISLPHHLQGVELNE